MQAPERRRLRVLRPENQCAATARTQNLLRCPECVSGLLRIDAQHLFDGKADVAQAEPVWRVRRLHECDRPVPRGAERGSQEPKLPDARLLDQQVHERADRPAAARQFGGQRRVARLNDPSTTTGELGRPPQGRVYLFSRNDSGGHEWIKNLYIYTVSYTQF